MVLVVGVKVAPFFSMNHDGDINAIQHSDDSCETFAFITFTPVDFFFGRATINSSLYKFKFFTIRFGFLSFFGVGSTKKMLEYSLQQIIKLGTKFLGTKMISSTNIHKCGRNLKFVYKNEAPYFFASRFEF